MVNKLHITYIVTHSVLVDPEGLSIWVTEVRGEGQVVQLVV